MNRTRQITVSAHVSRVHLSRWRYGEVGPIGADFTGALESGRSVVACTWTACGPVSLNAPGVTGNAVRTTVATTGRGEAQVSATVTLDNGEKRVQRFVLAVA